MWKTKHRIERHRDDSTSTTGRKGNFHAILSLLSDSDNVLRQHLLEGRKNAQYTSQTIQNQLIFIIGMFIRNHLTNILKSGEVNSFYSVIPDEVTDSSNKEILSKNFSIALSISSVWNTPPPPLSYCWVRLCIEVQKLIALSNNNNTGFFFWFQGRQNFYNFIVCV